MGVYVMLCLISLALASTGAKEDVNKVVTPCFELYKSGRCSTADFIGAIRCIDNVDPNRIDGDVARQALPNIRRLFSDKQQECDEWINGPNPKYNIVTEACYDLFDRGRCESADFKGAIKCIDDLLKSGKYSQEFRREFISTKRFWADLEAKCEDEKRYWQRISN